MTKLYIEPASSERKYRRLAALGKELGVPVPQAFLEMEVTMPDGRVVHHHRQRSHSWVRNAYNILFSGLAEVNLNAIGAAFGAGSLWVKDTSGVLLSGAFAAGPQVNVSIALAGKGYISGAGLVLMGIDVGSGANVESFEDFVLQTPITNGSGAGQLDYAASLAWVVAYDGPSKTMSATFVRFMNNNSVGNVLVNEVVLVANMYANNALQNLATSRDHLGATITIPATGQLKVTYVISLVYPA